MTEEVVIALFIGALLGASIMGLCCHLWGRQL